MLHVTLHNTPTTAGIFACKQVKSSVKIHPKVRTNLSLLTRLKHTRPAV